MKVAKNHYKYTKNELNLIHEYYRNIEFIYVYKFNYRITSYSLESIRDIDLVFSNYFYNKKNDKLCNFDKIIHNVTMVYKLLEVLNKNKVFINDNTHECRNKFLYSILTDNCDYLIKHFYEYENYNKYLGTFNNPTCYENCNQSVNYTRKISNINTLKNCLYIPDFDDRGYTFINSFVAKMNYFDFIINYHLYHYIDRFRKLNYVKKEDLLLLYNKKTKKITLEFTNDNKKEKFLKYLRKNHKSFIKFFIKFLEKNFDWDFIFRNVNHCYYCNKEMNLIDIKDLVYVYNSKNKEFTIIGEPIIHSKSICLVENNVIMNENINKYKLINIYEKLVIKLWKEVLFHKINYFNYSLTDLLLKYNLKTPSAYKILILSFPNENRKDYLSVFLQLRKKINSYQNNLFKIITNYLL